MPRKARRFIISIFAFTFGYFILHCFVKTYSHSYFVFLPEYRSCDVPIQIPTYVISIPNSKRKDRFIYKESRCFGELHFTDAVTEPNESFSVTNLKSTDLTIYVLASHIKAIQTAHQDHNDFALILEDDATSEFLGLFEHYLNYTLYDIAELMKCIDYVLLYYSSPSIVGASRFSSWNISQNLRDFVGNNMKSNWGECTRERWRCCFTNCNDWGAVAYIVNVNKAHEDLARKAKDQMQEMRYLVSDFVLFEGMKVKKHVPPIFGHVSFQSTIQDDSMISLQETFMNRLRHEWASVLAKVE